MTLTVGSASPRIADLSPDYGWLLRDLAKERVNDAARRARRPVSGRCEQLDNPARAFSVTERVVRPRHRGVGALVVEQALGLGDDRVRVSADELRRSRGDPFGPLGRL